MTDGPRVCSIARSLAVVGERWTLLALREVFLGVHRFDRIQRRTGAPRDILSARLRKLVDAGVLERRQYQDRPPRFEYHLTQAGRELQPVLVGLRQWGDRHLSGSEPPPAVFRHTCGSTTPVGLVCPDCGEAIEPGDLSLVRRTG